MNAHTRPREFAACTPPRVMWDLTLNRPVLLLGHWLDEHRSPLLAEVASMSTTRQPYQLRELPALEPIPQEEP